MKMEIENHEDILNATEKEFYLIKSQIGAKFIYQRKINRIEAERFRIRKLIEKETTEEKRLLKFMDFR
jgi:hypothetical protein